MNTAKTISAQVERLPLKLQEEVLNFIKYKYLVFRNSLESAMTESGPNVAKPRRSILELRGQLRSSLHCPPEHAMLKAFS